MTKKSYYVKGNYKDWLKQMNKEEKAYWLRVDNIKKQEAKEHKKVLLRCWIITERDLFPAGLC